MRNQTCDGKCRDCITYDFCNYDWKEVKKGRGWTFGNGKIVANRPSAIKRHGSIEKR
jgi:hypothetical protein